MKRFLKSALCVFLAVLLTVLGPAQAFASNAPTKQYISEVKVGMGDSAQNVLEAEGFTVVCDASGNPVDVNQGAGGGAGSHGNKKVLLGYKTTTDVKDAITDLAVMNMNGGYDVQEYEALMENYITAQIIPFIERFLVTINEYRDNYNSKDKINKKRAEYVHAALNKFTDDDCAGAPLGDLLLNETKYEMGDAAYDKLSDAEKNKHCDIVTLFAQADGQTMLTIYSLLTRAADTSSESWIDRFTGLTYDDMLESYDLPAVDAAQRAARDFEDDAKTLLEGWEVYRTLLLAADDNAQALEKMTMPDIENIQAKIDALNEKSTEEEIRAAYQELDDALALQSKMSEMMASVAAADFLESYEYEDGTLYDFFTRTSVEAASDIELLYPLVSSLSPGQRAGIEFLSLNEFVSCGNRDTEYSSESLKDVDPASVFEGIDRAIYQKGGVALTWDARRTNAVNTDVNLAERSKISTKMIVCYAVTGATLLATVGAAIGYGVRSAQLKAARAAYDQLNDKVIAHARKVFDNWNDPAARVSSFHAENRLSLHDYQTAVNRLAAATATAKWMAVGFAAATFIMTAVSAYMTWQDLKNYYKVDFTPIPHYMVDLVSITETENNETLVKENHAAYYAAVKCNRTSDDGFGGARFEMLGDCADLNGDVGQQWLALYACKNYKEQKPILADSFNVVVGSTELPAGYDRGIHMFGSDGSFDLNSKLYDWNQSAKSVFVYYKIDPTAEASTTGSVFSTGTLLLTAVGSLGLGAAATVGAMTAYRRRKESPAAV